MQRSGALTCLVVSWIVGGLLLTGCGNSQKGEQQAADSTTASGTDGSEASSELAGPAITVHAFLEGARLGDDAKVTSMLTSLARTELEKKQLPAAPKRSDTARFEVGQTRYPAEGIAHVASRWIDLEPSTGEMRAAEMTWVLRNEPEGWRIGGMAMTVFENEPPLLLNFEKPDEMIEQKQLLRAEIERRAQQNQSPATVAEKPENSPSR